MPQTNRSKNTEPHSNVKYKILDNYWKSVVLTLKTNTSITRIKLMQRAETTREETRRKANLTTRKAHDHETVLPNNSTPIPMLCPPPVMTGWPTDTGGWLADVGISTSLPLNSNRGLSTGSDR